MIIGCVKEIKHFEFRVGLTPDNAKTYSGAGHTVYMQKGAGLASSFSDDMYVAAGAEILDTAEEVWAKSDMIVKVKEPLEPEYELMREDQILYTFLHLAADRPLTEKLLEKRVKAVAYETIEDKEGGLPVLKPMSEVAGRLSVQMGARYLEKPMGGMGLLLSGVPGTRKANVVVIGGGVVGTSAMKMAMGLGADVTVIDNNLDRLTYLDDVFWQKIKTLYSTPPSIEKALMEADLVIGAVLIPGAAAPKLVKRAHLKKMKPGCVVVDVAVDQGGCFETTRMTYHDDPVYTVDGVIHYCVANMPGAVCQTSTNALTNATLYYGKLIADMGLEKALKAEPGLVPGVNCYGGHMTYQAIADEFNLPNRDVLSLI